MKTDLQFQYEKQALDVALATGSARVNFPTRGKAVQFRQRCYSFRKWKRELLGNDSPYELLTIKALGPTDTTVEITGRKFEGEIVPGDDAPVASPPPAKEEFAFTEEELAAAAAIKSALPGIDI